jgi:hypothetical protein
MSVISRVWQKSPRVAALVTDQVDLHEPWLVLVPLRPGTDRDLGLEQRAGLSPGPASQRQPGPLAGQPPVDRRSGHRHQPGGDIVADAQLAGPAQHRDDLGKERRHPLARRRVHHRPDLAQRRDHFRAVHRRARPAWLRQLRLQGLPEGLPRVITMPARQRAQLIENDFLPGPVRPLVSRRGRLRDGLALAHRQSHNVAIAPNRTAQAPTRR